MKDHIEREEVNALIKAECSPKVAAYLIDAVAAIPHADAIEELTGFVQEAERDRDEYRERLDKANDAIEELSKQLDDMNEANIALYGSMPKWIPVTERRAEFPCICCDANGNLPFIPQGLLTITDAQGTWQIDAHLADPRLHQGKVKPVLGYGNRITHWMPLPEPPEEK